MLIPDAILLIISQYASEYVLLDWIKLDKLDWKKLSANPKAIDLLLKNRCKIKWVNFVKNPHPRAVDLIEENICYVDDFRLEKKGNYGSQYLNSLCENTNPRIMEFIEKFLETKTLTGLQWSNLTRNPSAISILEKEIKKGNDNDNVNWLLFPQNPNSDILIKKYPEKVVQWNFSRQIKQRANIIKLKSTYEDPEYIKTLEKNKNTIDYNNLSDKPFIFEYNLIKIYNILKEVKF